MSICGQVCFAVRPEARPVTGVEYLRPLELNGVP